MEIGTKIYGYEPIFVGMMQKQNPAGPCTGAAG